MDRFPIFSKKIANGADALTDLVGEIAVVALWGAGVGGRGLGRGIG